MMTPIQPSVQSLRQRQVRFGAKQQSADAADAMARLRQDIKDVDARMKNLRHITVNETPLETDTPISRGVKKIKKGTYTLATLGVLGVLGLVGATNSTWGYRGYQQAKPEEVVVQRDAAMQPDWRPLAEKLRVADELGRAEDALLRKEIMGALQGFMIRAAMTLEQYPTEDVDRTLLREIYSKVKNDPTFMPTVAAEDLATQLEQYLRNTAKLPSNPTERDINAAFRNFQPDFLDLTPPLDQLTRQQKDDLTNSLKRKIKDNAFDVQANSNYKHLFTPIFEATLSLQGGYAGVDLAAFLAEYHGKAHTREGAIALFRQVAANDANFKTMTGAEREAYLKHGQVVLEALDHESPSPLWGLAVGLLVLASAGGLLTVAVRKRDEVFAVPGALLEIKEGLNNPTLFVTNDNQADVEGGTRAERLNARINEQAGHLAETVRAVFDGNPLVHEFLTELYGGRDKLPDQQYVRQRFTYPVVNELLAKQGTLQRLKQEPISQVQLLEILDGRVESAVLTGSLLSNPVAELKPPALAGGNREQLEAQRAWMDKLITASMVTYCNSQFGEHSAVRKVEKLRAALESLEAEIERMAASGRDETDADLAAKLTRQGWLSSDLQLAERFLGDARNLAHHARQTMDEYIEPLRQYRGRLNQAILDQNYQQTAQELLQVRDESGRLQRDPKLEEALNGQLMEQFITEHREKQQQLAARVDAAVAEQMAKLQQKRAS